MLIPQFISSPIKYVDQDGQDITSTVANPGGFIKVDAQYGLPYEELRRTPDAWPATYQNPAYPNIFAAGMKAAALGLTFGDFKAGDLKHKKERVSFVRSDKGWLIDEQRR